MIYIGFVFDVEKPDLEKYMHADFIKSMRDILRDNGVIDVNKKPDDLEGQFLIGYKGGLYLIDSDFEVSQSEFPYHAIGSGTDYALGVLNYFYESGQMENGNPEVILRWALTAAEKHNIYIRQPFVYLDA